MAVRALAAPLLAPLTALAIAAVPTLAAAQQGNAEWFVPPGPQRPAGQPAARPAPRPAAGTPAPGAPMAPDGFNAEEQAPPLTPQQLQMQLPPAPEVATLPKGSPAPAASIGVLSVPDVQRMSTAFQQAYKELTGRLQQLNDDVRKESNAQTDIYQQLVNERSKLTPEQIRTKERELNDRRTSAGRKFTERRRIIQEAYQYVMAQIDRTLEQVLRQVMVSRGINLVLNGAQVLGAEPDFDLTPQVAEVLNKVLPSVVIPPDGVSPLSMPKPGAAAQTGSGLMTPGPGSAPASAGSAAVPPPPPPPPPAPAAGAKPPAAPAAGAKPEAAPTAPPARH
jgi:Skp family chaperone for outer membrane proteins